MIIAINYDLKKPGRKYDDLYEAIKKCGSSWWHYLDSTWLVDTNLTAAQVWERLEPYIDQNDTVLIIGVTADKAGWLTTAAWDWINSRRNKLAA